MNKIKFKVALMLAKFGLFIPAIRFKNINQTIDFRLDGWVIISDGHSKDALPVILCSQELVGAIEHQIKAINP